MVEHSHYHRYGLKGGVGTGEVGLESKSVPK